MSATCYAHATHLRHAQRAGPASATSLRTPYPTFSTPTSLAPYAHTSTCPIPPDAPATAPYAPPSTCPLPPYAPT
eukprot:367430-Rhodomonas_salina.7